MVTAVKESMRDRLIAAGGELFYAFGLRAVSVDKVLEQAQTTKVTFYRHFKSKDDLVVAYLRHSAERESAAVAAALSAGSDAGAALASLGEMLGAAACRPGFRGCAFINAAAEYPDPTSGPRQVVDEHRAWFVDTFADLLAPLDLPDARAVAEDLLLLRDGAMVAGYLGEPERLAASFARSSRAVVGLGPVAAEARPR